MRFALACRSTSEPRLSSPRRDSGRKRKSSRRSSSPDGPVADGSAGMRARCQARGARRHREQAAFPSRSDGREDNNLRAERRRSCPRGRSRSAPQRSARRRAVASAAGALPSCCVVVSEAAVGAHGGCVLLDVSRGEFRAQPENERSSDLDTGGRLTSARPPAVRHMRRQPPLGRRCCCARTRLGRRVVRHSVDGFVAATPRLQPWSRAARQPLPSTARPKRPALRCEQRPGAERHLRNVDERPDSRSLGVRVPRSRSETSRREAPDRRRDGAVHLRGRHDHRSLQYLRYAVDHRLRISIRSSRFWRSLRRPSLVHASAGAGAMRDQESRESGFPGPSRSCARWSRLRFPGAARMARREHFDGLAENAGRDRGSRGLGETRRLFPGAGRCPQSLPGRLSARLAPLTSRLTYVRACRRKAPRDGRPCWRGAGRARAVNSSATRTTGPAREARVLFVPDLRAVLSRGRFRGPCCRECGDRLREGSFGGLDVGLFNDAVDDFLFYRLILLSFEFFLLGDFDAGRLPG